MLWLAISPGGSDRDAYFLGRLSAVPRQGQEAWRYAVDPFIAKCDKRLIPPITELSAVAAELRARAGLASQACHPHPKRFARTSPGTSG